MSSVHRKIGSGVAELGKNIKIQSRKMPLGIDGLVVDHLLQYYFYSKGVFYASGLNNTVQISSKEEEYDFEKIKRVVLHAANYEEPLYALDMRTVTGSLGVKLRKVIEEIETESGRNVEFNYAVVFDKNGNADLCGLEEELTEEEREEVYWVKGKEAVRKLIHQENGEWEYNLSNETIANFEPVPLIKKEIDILIRRKEILLRDLI